jgi:hypothetical protein
MTSSEELAQEGNLEIKDIVFLTPAKVKLLENGEEKTVMFSVDIINRKAYTQDGSSHLSELFFNHLDEVTAVPEDFFAASDEVMEEVAQAQKQKDEIVEQIFSGVIHE